MPTCSNKCLPERAKEDFVNIVDKSCRPPRGVNKSINVISKGSLSHKLILLHPSWWHLHFSPQREKALRQILELW